LQAEKRKGLAFREKEAPAKQVIAEKAAGEGSLFHEGSININKGLYNAKDLGESLAHPNNIA